MRRLVFLTCLLASLMHIAFAQSGAFGAPETPAPALSEPVDISTVQDNKSWLGAWMSYNKGPIAKPVLTPWDGGYDVPVQPNTNLEGFGPLMCNMVSMCAPNDQYYDFASQAMKPSVSAPTPCTLCTNRSRNLFIIHVVYWQAAQDGVAPPVAPVTTISYKSSAWYFYKSDGKGHYIALQPKLSKDRSSFTLPDIYDVDNGFVISVSRVTTTDTETNLLAPNITYTPTVTLVTPTWLAGLETIASSLSGVTVSSSAPSTTKGPAPRPEVFKAHIKVTAISPNSVRRPFTVAIAATATGQNGVTVDCAALGMASNCAFQTSATVLARDFVAFGGGIVPHGPKETIWTTNSTTNAITPATSNHNNFYGFVDFAPWPARFPMTRWPYFQGGLPLTGVAIHLPYAGVATPFPWFRKELAVSLFGGFVIMQQQDPAGGRDRAIKALWGIEVPIASLGSQISKVTGNPSKKGGS